MIQQFALKDKQKFYRIRDAAMEAAKKEFPDTTDVLVGIRVAGIDMCISTLSFTPEKEIQMLKNLIGPEL
jgi:hypothetical protein